MASSHDKNSNDRSTATKKKIKLEDNSSEEEEETDTTTMISSTSASGDNSNQHDNQDHKKTFQVPANLLSRCQRVYDWDADFTTRAITGYRHFMDIKVNNLDIATAECVAPPIIRRVWQQHILDVNDYTEACEEFCGGLIHHNPDDTPSGAIEQGHGRFSRTMRLIEAHQKAHHLQLEGDIWSFDKNDSKVASFKKLAASRKRRRAAPAAAAAPEANNNDDNTKKQQPGTTPLTIFARRYHSRGDAPNNGQIGQGGFHSDLYFRILPTTRMSRLFSKFSEHAGLQGEALTFLFQNKLVQPTDSAHSLGMKEGDMMHASQSATVED